jgi:hypothetical protein
MSSNRSIRERSVLDIDKRRCKFDRRRRSLIGGAKKTRPGKKCMIQHGYH